MALRKKKTMNMVDATIELEMNAGHYYVDIEAGKGRLVGVTMGKNRKREYWWSLTWR